MKGYMKKQEVSIVKGVLSAAYPTINKTFTAVLAAYPKGIYAACDAADHGMKQKFGDAASGKSPAEKYAEVQEIHASLMAGEWNRTANPVDRTPEILEAVADVMKLKYDAAKGHLTDGKKVCKPTEEMVKTWGSNPEVKVKIQERRLAKAKEVAEKSEKLSIELK